MRRSQPFYVRLQQLCSPHRLKTSAPEHRTPNTERRLYPCGLLALTCCVLLLPAAHAQDTYRLTEKSAVGDAVQVEEVMSMDLNLSAKAGGSTPLTMQAHMQETQKYAQSVLSLDTKGKPSGLRRTYTVYRQSETADKKQKTETSPLQGKTVVIQRKGNATTLTGVPSSLPKDARVSLQHAFENEFDFLPDKAIAPGEEWQVDPQSFLRVSSLKEAKDVTVTCKLLDIVSYRQHRCARIHVSMHVELPMDKATSMLVDFGGDGYLALDIQRMLGLDLRGPVLFTGLGTGKEGALESGEGTAHLQLTLHWQQIGGKPVRE